MPLSANYSTLSTLMLKEFQAFFVASYPQQLDQQMRSSRLVRTTHSCIAHIDLELSLLERVITLSDEKMVVDNSVHSITLQLIQIRIDRTFLSSQLQNLLIFNMKKSFSVVDVLLSIIIKVCSHCYPLVDNPNLEFND